VAIGDATANPLKNTNNLIFLFKTTYFLLVSNDCGGDWLSNSN
jgi:hypothetical protein